MELAPPTLLLNLRRALHASAATGAGAAAVHAAPVDFQVLATCLASCLTLLGQDVPILPSVFKGEIGPKLKLAELILTALGRAGLAVDIQAHQMVLGTDFPALATLVDTAAHAASAQRQNEQASAANKRQSSPRASPSVASQQHFKSASPGNHNALPSDVSLVPHRPLVYGKPSAKMFQSSLEKLESAIFLRRTLLEENAKLKQQLADLQASSPADLVILLRELETLKQREKEFRNQCRTERERLEALANGVPPGTTASSSVTSARTLPVKAPREPVLKCEVFQFQRRFSEVYAEMASIADEERDCIDTFNMLSARLKLLDTESQTLRSLFDGYLKSQGHARMRDELVGQFRGILADLDEREAKAKAKRAVAIARRDAQQAELARLLAIEREYFEAVRQLHELSEG